MKKLELHHIDKRLSKGLKFFNYTVGEVCTLFCVDTEENIYKTIAEDDYEVYASNGYDMKPIFFPLNCLTQEITIKGETFVPIVEIMKMINVKGNLFEVEDGVMSFGWDENYGEDSQGYSVDWDEYLKQFVVGYAEDINYETGIHFDNGTDGKYSFLYELPFSYSAFEKLLEWHFDTDNLIEQNLAISALELETNPYS